MSIANLLVPNNYNLYIDTISGNASFEGDVTITPSGQLTLNGPTIVNAIIGYSKGPLVTQTGSATTAITSNALAASVLTFSTTIAALGSVSFIINNNNIVASTYMFTQVSVFSGLGTYPTPVVLANISPSNPGQATITLYNPSTTTAYTGTTTFHYIIF